jgi:hypothetical protein
MIWLDNNTFLVEHCVVTIKNENVGDVSER